MRIVLDANVLVSGVFWSGYPHRVLVWRYPETPDAPVGGGRVSIRLPTRPSLPPHLFRIDGREHNILAAWRALGSPAYPTRAQLNDLQARNGLVPAADGSVVLRQDGDAWYAEFELERPGVALLELA